MIELGFTFEDWLERVYEQLYENTTEEWREEYPYNVFNYTREDIDNNLEYFRDCYKRGLSAYKSLTFFSIDEKHNYS